MRLSQRPEIWFLLAAGALAAWWALRDPQPYDAAEARTLEKNSAATPGDAVLRIQRSTLTRDFGNARLDIEFHFENRSQRPLFLQPPDVRLIAGESDEVPVFILPTEKPPRVAEHAAADLRLRFWLEKAHLLGPLRLEIRGQTAQVKTAAPLDLESLTNDQPRTWTSSEWK